MPSSPISAREARENFLELAVRDREQGPRWSTMNGVPYHTMHVQTLTLGILIDAVQHYHELMTEAEEYAAHLIWCSIRINGIPE